MLEKIKNYIKKYNKNKEEKLSFSRKQRNKKFSIFKYNINERKRIETKNDYTLYYYFFWFILIVLTIYTLFFSPYFIIKNIEIIKNDSISNINIAYKSINNVRYKNIFTINKTKIKKSIIELQNNIEKIRITKNFPNTLQIEIESYPPIFKTKISKKDYLILENWSIIPWTYNKDIENLNIKNNVNNNNISYKNIISKDNINKIQKSITYIKNNIYIDKIKEINFFPNEKEIHISIYKDEKIILLLNKNLDNQLKKLILLRNENKFNLNDLVYIDLRIKNKVYICKKENLIFCDKNLKRIYNYK